MSGVDNCETCGGTAPDSAPISSSHAQSQGATRTSTSGEEKEAAQPLAKGVVPQPYDTSLAGPSTGSTSASASASNSASSQSESHVSEPAAGQTGSGKDDLSAQGQSGASDEQEKKQALLDSEDMQPPPAVYPSVIIEFCDRCRW
jgi:hypothetical protein